MTRLKHFLPKKSLLKNLYALPYLLLFYIVLLCPIYSHNLPSLCQVNHNSSLQST